MGCHFFVCDSILYIKKKDNHIGYPSVTFLLECGMITYRNQVHFVFSLHF